MKGLLKTSGVIEAFVVVGTIAAIIISSGLNNRLAAAYERGYAVVWRREDKEL